MSYEHVMNDLTGKTADVITRLWEAAEQGLFTGDEFTTIAAELIALARVQGAIAAQATLRAYIEAAAGHPVASPGLTIHADMARMTKAVGTILDGDGNTLMQLIRLAMNEPLDAAAQAYHDAMTETAVVSGWRRGLNSAACQLCQWWWREGRVWQKTHKMPRHPGCTCHQLPVIDERTANYQTSQQAAGAARSNERRNR
jgi:hypothetical protein